MNPTVVHASSEDEQESTTALPEKPLIDLHVDGWNKAPPHQTSPAAKLPNELLAEIFYCLKARYYKEGARWDAWLKVTWVCQYWRAVAVETAGLWAFVEAGNRVELLRVFLERSRDVMVTLIVNKRNKDIPATVELVRRHAQHIKTLEVESYEATVAVFVYLLQFAMPALTTLGLIQFVANADAPIVPRNGDFISYHPSASQFPRLETLYLDNIRLCWDCELFSDLVDLELNTLGWVAIPSMELLLELLHRSPRLRRFKLACSGPDFDDFVLPQYPEPSRIVAMPSLREMILTTDSSVVAWHLAHFALSANTRIEIRGEFIEPHAQPGQILPSYLPRDLTFLEMIPVIRAVHVQGTGESVVLDAYAHPGDAVTLLSISAFGCGPAFPNAANDLALLFGDSVLELDITGIQEEDAPVDWKQVFLKFPKLERLKVDDKQFDEVLITLNSALCPSLHTISFVKHDTPFWPWTLHIAVDVLRHRAERGFRLKTLSLAVSRKEHMSTHTEHLEQLHSLVDNLEHFYLERCSDIDEQKNLNN